MNAVIYKIRPVLLEYQWPFVWVCLAAGGAIAAFPLSWVLKTNTLAGLCLLPFAFFIEGKARFNVILFSGFLFFGIVSFVWSVRTFFFFGIAFYILFMIELVRGRPNSIILFLIVFMSPFFDQLSVIIGFPLRIQISNLAGILLAWSGQNIAVEGNLMILNGASFAMEDACLGLNMLVISFLAGTFTIIRFYRASGKRLSLIYTGFFFLAVLAFNLASNIFRILFLVTFKILPEDPLHECIGIICFLLYVLIPVQLTANRLIAYAGKPGARVSSFSFTTGSKAALSGACVLLFITGLHINYRRQLPDDFSIRVSLPGFTYSKSETNIIKLLNDDLLVYVKPIPEFFTGEHTPLMCWRGSGYKFKSINKINFHGREIYTGSLEKKGGSLFTAWWYSNGKKETTDQLTWRWAMMKGEDRFCLVNMTASNEATLFKNLAPIFENKLLTLNTNDEHVAHR